MNNPIMYTDPSGHIAITTLLIGMAIGFGVGAAIGGGFEIAKQAYNGGNWNWDLLSWDWEQIGLSALGGGVAGAISSISLGTGFVGYLSAFALGGIGSVAGGLISGSVTDFQSTAIAFGIGAIANVAAKGIADLINKGVTAGAILAEAPAIAGYASTMAVAYTGSLALGSAAATAISVGAGVLAVGTVAIGVNEGVAALTGYNAGRELMGDGAYDAVSTIITLGGASYIAGGMTLPYPSTGNTGSNLNLQLAIEEASSNPNAGHVISNIKMKDPRMPYWLGWQKYSYKVNGIDVHYVRNRLFPKWHPYSPWLDYKIK